MCFFSDPNCCLRFSNGPRPLLRRRLPPTLPQEQVTYGISVVKFLFVLRLNGYSNLCCILYLYGVRQCCIHSALQLIGQFTICHAAKIKCAKSIFQFHEVKRGGTKGNKNLHISKENWCMLHV